MVICTTPKNIGASTIYDHPDDFHFVAVGDLPDSATLEFSVSGELIGVSSSELLDLWQARLDAALPHRRRRVAERGIRRSGTIRGWPDTMPWPVLHPDLEDRLDRRPPTQTFLPYAADRQVQRTADGSYGQFCRAYHGCIERMKTRRWTRDDLVFPRGSYRMVRLGMATVDEDARGSPLPVRG